MTPLALAIINALAVLGPPAIDAITRIIQAQHGAPSTEADHYGARQADLLGAVASGGLALGRIAQDHPAR